MPTAELIVDAMTNAPCTMNVVGGRFGGSGIDQLGATDAGSSKAAAGTGNHPQGAVGALQPKPSTKNA